MSNFKKTIEKQKAIDEAVDAIFQYFKKETSYPELLETAANAQLEFIQLMDLNRSVDNCDDGIIESVPVPLLTDFFYETNRVFKLLRPFANLIGQVYGNKD